MNPSNEQPPGDLPGHQLCDADMRVLDFLAEHGFDASRLELLPPEDRPRAMALIRQMQVLDHYPAGDSDDSLVDATLARIDRWEAARESSMRLRVGRFSNFRAADFVGVAALIMVGLGVLLPIAAHAREQRLNTVCGNNMRSLHDAFGAYAHDHGGALPLAASIGGGLGSIFSPTSGNAGAAAPSPAATPAATPALGRTESPQAQMQVRPRSVTTTMVQGNGFSMVVVEERFDVVSTIHSNHLNVLVDKAYVDTHALQCPACAAGLPCFAYRVPVRGQRFALDTPGRHVLIADSNPLVEAKRAGRPAPSRTANSSNHGGNGQNMLFHDGSIEWTTSPVISTSPAGFMDNIWLSRQGNGREGLDDLSWPTDETDNFVSQ